MVIASHFKAISEGHTLITSVHRAFYSTDVFSEVFSRKNALLVSPAVIEAASNSLTQYQASMGFGILNVSFYEYFPCPIDSVIRKSYALHTQGRCLTCPDLRLLTPIHQ